MPDQREFWREEAMSLLEAVVLRGDEYGDIANHTADELRDALTVAGDLLRRIATARRGYCEGQEWTDIDGIPEEIEGMWRTINDSYDCRSNAL